MKEAAHLGDLVVERTVLFKRMLREIRTGIKWIQVAQFPPQHVRSNEFPICVKFLGIFLAAEILSASQKGPYFMALDISTRNITRGSSIRSSAVTSTPITMIGGHFVLFCFFDCTEGHVRKY
jgi:hypothetical protein